MWLVQMSRARGLALRRYPSCKLNREVPGKHLKKYVI